MTPNYKRDWLRVLVGLFIVLVLTAWSIYIWHLTNIFVGGVTFATYVYLMYRVVRRK